MSRRQTQGLFLSLANALGWAGPEEVVDKGFPGLETAEM